MGIFYVRKYEPPGFHMGLGVSSQRALCAWERGGLFILAGIQALPTLSYHTLGLPTFPLFLHLPSFQGIARLPGQELRRRPGSDFHDPESPRLEAEVTQGLPS